MQDLPSGRMTTPPAMEVSWSRVSSELVIVLREVVEVALREHTISGFTLCCDELNQRIL